MCHLSQSMIQSLAHQEGLGSISLCSCGTVSLHIGGVSIRMELSTFVQTVEMCQQGMKALKMEALTLLKTSRAPVSTTTH